MFSFRHLGGLRYLSVSVFFCLTLLTLPVSTIRAQKAGADPAGLAWQVRGPWLAEGNAAPIVAGDAILPGSLLEPIDGTAPHSITLLLPDGQRILYECFTVEDCARGFRVPLLYRVPEPFAVDMLARIHAVLARENHAPSTASSTRPPSPLPRDEVVAELGPDNRAQVAGLAATLPKGRYTYDVTPLDQHLPRKFHVILEKNSPSISVELPDTGVYALTITDDMKTQRIDLFVAAVRPASAAQFKKSFGEAKALMDEWNGYYQGWPVHDLKRAYLESLMLGVKPQPIARQAGVDGKIASNAAEAGGPRDVTAEPMFTPKAGLFAGETEVTLRCITKDAIIHYTVDGSQPMATSPVYRAPIIVKGTELTIKSFAAAPGRKDSPVVTGIFRIREQP